MKKLFDIKHLFKKDEKYIYYYTEIYKLTSILDNQLRNKNKFINWIFCNPSFCFLVYEKNTMLKLYELVKSITDEYILFDKDINKMIHTPWICYYYFKDNSKPYNNELFFKYIKEVVCPDKLLYSHVLLTYMVIKNKKRLNILADKNSFINYKVISFNIFEFINSVLNIK